MFFVFVVAAGLLSLVEGESHPLDENIRRVERGSRIVVAVTLDTKVVLQVWSCASVKTKERFCPQRKIHFRPFLQQQHDMFYITFIIIYFLTDASWKLGNYPPACSRFIVSAKVSKQVEFWCDSWLACVASSVAFYRYCRLSHSLVCFYIWGRD